MQCSVSGIPANPVCHKECSHVAGEEQLQVGNGQDENRERPFQSVARIPEMTWRGNPRSAGHVLSECAARNPEDHDRIKVRRAPVIGCAAQLRGEAGSETIGGGAMSC
jgi:hypothetical protein